MADAPVVWAYDETIVIDARGDVSGAHAPQGGRMGTFILRPIISADRIYDDNIYRTKNGARADWQTSLKPELTAQSDWNLHQISAGVTGDFSKYARQGSEDYSDFAYYISGKYDVDYGTYFSGLLRRDHAHEDRSDIEDADGDAPTEFDVTTASLGFTRALSIIKLSLDGTYKDYTFEDSTRASTPIDNSQRDHSEAYLKAKLSYDMTDQAQTYIQIGHDRRQYEQNGAAYRDSAGYDVRLGGRVNITGKLEGDVFAGWMLQKYERNLPDITAPSYGGSLLWRMSDLTSFKGIMTRRIVETTLANASGSVRTNFTLSAQHSATQDILLDGKLGLEQDRHEGSDVSRDNQSYLLGLGLEYYMNYGLSARLAYDYALREYELGTNNGYENNKFLVSVRYAY